jgi:hypothetical protein
MDRSTKIIIKLEFDRLVKYLSSRNYELTTEELLQEIGALRMFIETL